MREGMQGEDGNSSIFFFFFFRSQIRRGVETFFLGEGGGGGVAHKSAANCSSSTKQGYVCASPSSSPETYDVLARLSSSVNTDAPRLSVYAASCYLLRSSYTPLPHSDNKLIYCTASVRIVSGVTG